MRILSRYALLEFGKVFLVTLGVTTTLIMIVGVAMEAMRQGLGLVQILRVMPYFVPESLRFSVPATALFATCSVYGRLASSNEIVAVKASGVSPLVLLWPVVSLGVVLSFVSVWLNDVAVTWGRRGVQRVVVESVEEIAYGMLRTKRSYATKQVSMNVRRVEGRALIKPTLTVQKESGETITINADEADLRSDLDAGTLTVRFYNAVIDVGEGKGGITWPGVYEHVVNFDDFSRRGSESISPSNLGMREIPIELKRTEDEMKAIRQQAAAQSAFALATGRYDELIGNEWKEHGARLANAERHLHRLQTEPPRRWANGASCLCFIFVGAPVAILMRRGEFLTSFFAVFAPIIGVYYPLLITATSHAKSGEWPPESVWLGNLVLLAAGILLLRRVRRY